MKGILNRVFNALPPAIDVLVKSKSFAKSAVLKGVRENLQDLHKTISEIIAPTPKEQTGNS